MFREKMHQKVFEQWQREISFSSEINIVHSLRNIQHNDNRLKSI
jgi:hypothetical protein